MIEIRLVPGCGDTRDALAIRREVFVEEQGFSGESEFDAIDREALHALVLSGGEPAATARLYAQDGSWHIGRVAVRKAFRGRGLARAAVRMLMSKAASLGAAEIHVGAQRRAEGFYARLGFTPCGQEYTEEGVPHVPMKAAAHAGCECRRTDASG
jgi:predicted GNAT family N-acyltransferase